MTVIVETKLKWTGADLELLPENDERVEIIEKF